VAVTVAVAVTAVGYELPPMRNGPSFDLPTEADQRRSIASNSISVRV
jgi:hypothetical protein